MDGQQQGNRHLAQSVFAEDILKGGHTAVWGSYFETTIRRWGYACCRSTEQGGRCSLAQPEVAPQAAGMEEDEDDDEEKARQAWRSSRLLDAEPPSELAPRSRGRDEDYLAQFVLYWFHAWSKGGADARGGRDAKTVQQTRDALLPLLQQLQRNVVDKELVKSLSDVAEMAQNREYAQANDVYIALTVGNALWHQHLDLGEQRAHWSGSDGLRTMQRQVVEKDWSRASSFDTDPVVQRYVHALKRLVTYMQAERPSEDPSKNGHVPAQKPDASELGLRVFRGVRDSDGRGHMPEYVEPDDPRFNGPSGDRGLAFGTRTDRTGMNVPTGRNSHPFAAV